MVTLTLVENETADLKGNNHGQHVFSLHSGFWFKSRLRNLVDSSEIAFYHQIHTNRDTRIVLNTVKSKVWFGDGLFFSLV